MSAQLIWVAWCGLLAVADAFFLVRLIRQHGISFPVPYEFSPLPAAPDERATERDLRRNR